MTARSPAVRMRWSDRLLARILACAATGAALLLCSYLCATGRISYTAGALLLALSPVIAYVALSRPYLFPYGLYVFAIPFDSLLAISGTGSSAVRVLGAVAGIALLLYGLRLKHFNPPPLSIGTWALYAAWVAATMMWAINPQDSTAAVGTFCQLVLLYTVVAMTPITRNGLKTVLWAAILGGVAAGAYGAWTFYHQQASVLAEAQAALARLQIGQGDNYTDPNHYADSLLFPAIALTVIMLRQRIVWRKLACGAGIAVMVGGIYFSASRESLVALVLAWVYLACVARRYRRQLAIVLGGAFAISLALPMVWIRFAQASTSGGSGRLSIWRVGLAAARDHWLAGAGIMNFANAYNDKYIAVYQGYLAGWSRVAHDLILQTVVELGVVGLVILGLALAVQFTLLAHIEPGDDLYDYRLMLQSSMLALLVAALFIDMMMYKYLWLVFATMTQVYALSRKPVRVRDAYVPPLDLELESGALAP